jgi:hypothetical protein
MSRTYACVIARTVVWGDQPTVRAVIAPLTLEEALQRLARRDAGEIGRVLRLPAALPEPGTVFQTSDPAALRSAAWPPIKREVGSRRAALGRPRRSPAADLT